MSYAGQGLTPTLPGSPGVYPCGMNIPDKHRKTPAFEEPPIQEPTTGTVDDQDEPGDEREDENEVPVDAPREDTEAPEEFERIDEVREPPYPDGSPA